MGYTVTLYKFAKKKNSTAKPSNTTPKKQFNGKLMNESGIINPTFTFDFSILANTNAYDYNYAYISEWDRYYFINDWSYNMGLWNCSMSIDVLASWKTTIGSHSTYVLRSSSTYDRYLTDHTYPIKCGASFSVTTQNSNPFATTFSGGYFVVGIINGDSASYGAVSYYVFTSAEFRSFAVYLLGNINVFHADEISDQLMKVLFNPFQYIVSCTWLPVAPPMGSVLSSITLGWWNISSVSCHRLGSTVRASGTVTITIPVHPQSSTRKYLQGEPYSQYYLDFPPFGSVSVPANYLIGASTIDFYWDCDCITGCGRLDMGADYSTKPFNIMHGMVGVPIQLAQMTPDITGAIQQLVPSSGNAKIDAVTDTLASIGSALIQSHFGMQSTGGTGGFMGGYYPIRLTGMFYSVADENASEFGVPCCKTLTINTLSGFVQCAHGDFEGICTQPETDMINGYLTSGFFYE